MGSERRICFETQCVMALQGQPRSLILTSIESAYATSYRSSIVTLVLSCPVSEILKVSREERHTPICHPNFRGVPFGLDCRCCSSEERYAQDTSTSQTDGRTDGRTIYDSNTALALRASRVYTGRLKMQDWNLADQIAGLENAGLENARPENAGQDVFDF